jgi:hypothetical protein
MMRAALLACGLAVAATPALAADAACAKFNWPVDRELALLRAPRPDTAPGAAVAGGPPFALTLKLATGATLPSPSEKATDPAKFSGFVTFAAPKPGDYLVSLSGEAWIDVIQDGKPVASTMHSGDPNCPDLRKSVRFTLTAMPVTLQISNAPSDRILIAITPWFWGATPPQ